MEGAETDLFPSPSKRRKISSETLASSSPPDPNPKGKEKIISEEDREQEPCDEEGDAEIRTCGICFSEEASRSIRGEIDSCGHYFCFVCIMEWSKVESRCPLCKQRFISIRRPPVEGIFPLERLVIVPERNQVYHPLGNVSEGPVDLYADVSCSYCQNSSNENLLLLCDLCDSAAHTYCVGLGYDVPEGDWFCADCMVSKNEQSKIESNDDCGNIYSEKLDSCCRRSCPVLISEIVSEEDPSISPQRTFSSTGTQIRLASGRLDRVANENDSSPPESLVDRVITTRENVFASDSTNTGQNARTLRRCRDVHGRIQRFRQNWNNLRNGSLTFRLTCMDSSQMDSRRKVKRRSDPIISNERVPLCPGTSSQTVQDSKVSDVPTNSCSSTEVDRAWRMMKAARLVQPVAKRGFAGLHEQKLQNKGSSLSNRDKISPFFASETQPNEVRTFGTTVSRNGHKHVSTCPEKVQLKFRGDHVKRDNSNNLAEQPQMHEIQQEENLKESSYLSSIKLELDVLEKKAQCRQEVQVSGGRSRICSSHGLTNASLVSLIPDTKRSEGNKLLLHDKESVNKGKTCDNKDAKISKVVDCDPKSEIQSIVKLNMKLQRIDACLGSEGFKKVARIATHTILAACGFDHSESVAREVPKVLCKHSAQIRLIKHCTLMPDSCRECFYAFARDVVANVSSELVIQASHRSSISKV